LRLTEVTSCGSVLAFAAYAVSVWLHILTLGLDILVSWPKAVQLWPVQQAHTPRVRICSQTLTAHAAKANTEPQLVTSVKRKSWLPDHGPCIRRTEWRTCSGLMLIRSDKKTIYVKIRSFDRLLNHITRLGLLSMRRVGLSAVRLRGLRVRKPPMT
jgi:hypothetical protein